MIIATLFYVLYLVLDARQDSLYIRKYGLIYHKWNWALRAVTGLGIGYAHYQNWVCTLAYAGLLIPLTWIIFDIAINLFLGKNPITYIGSGDWDEVFKWLFDKNFRRKQHLNMELSHRPVMAMWIVKLTLLALAIGFFIHYTRGV